MVRLSGVGGFLSYPACSSKALLSLFTTLRVICQCSGVRKAFPPVSRIEPTNVAACSGCTGEITFTEMSLIDKESDVSKSLRLLLIGYRQDEIDLTPDNSPFTIGHKPASCPLCTEWHKEVREIGRSHPDLFDKDGYVKESVIGTLDIGQQQRLHEIGQLMDTHLKKVYDEELARGTKEAAEEDQFQW
jgi:hypothetical protein